MPAVMAGEIHADTGDVARALASVNTIKDQAGKQEALSRVALALASVGNLDAAKSVVEKITSPEVQDRTWFEIACSAPVSK